MKEQPETKGLAICTCDALTILVLEELEGCGMEKKVIHAAILQKWKENVGKYPEDLIGKYNITDGDGRTVKVNIVPKEVDSYDPQFSHLLVTQNHHQHGNHTLYVKDKYKPQEGEYKDVDVYDCDDDVWCRENVYYKIPVNYPGNILYKVDVSCSPFEETDDPGNIQNEIKQENSLLMLPTGQRKRHSNETNLNEVSTLKKKVVETNLNEVSTTKKKVVNRHGYIDGATRVFRARSGKTDYFRFDIVSKSDDYNVVCFDKQRHLEILNESNSNVIYNFTDLSYKNGDYIMDATTNWVKVKTTAPNTYEKHLKITDIADATNNLKLFRRIHVVGIIYGVTDLIPTKTGVRRKLGVIHDASGSLRIMIHGEHNIDISEDTLYRIDYLWLTSYKGSRILSTTYETNVHSGYQDESLESYLLSQTRSDIGIQNSIGKVVLFSANDNKRHCPDCFKEVREKTHEKATCDNEHCEIEEMSVDVVESITYIRFRLKMDKDQKPPLLRCPTHLLYKLFDIHNNDDALISRLSRDELLNKFVDVKFDADDYEVVDIKFHDTQKYFI